MPPSSPTPRPRSQSPTTTRQQGPYGQRTVVLPPPTPAWAAQIPIPQGPPLFATDQKPVNTHRLSDPQRRGLLFPTEPSPPSDPRRRLPCLPPGTLSSNSLPLYALAFLGLKGCSGSPETQGEAFVSLMQYLATSGSGKLEPVVLSGERARGLMEGYVVAGWTNEEEAKTILSREFDLSMADTVGSVRVYSVEGIPWKSEDVLRGGRAGWDFGMALEREAVLAAEQAGSPSTTSAACLALDTNSSTASHPAAVDQPLASAWSGADLAAAQLPFSQPPCIHHFADSSRFPKPKFDRYPVPPLLHNLAATLAGYPRPPTPLHPLLLPSRPPVPPLHVQLQQQQQLFPYDAGGQSSMFAIKGTPGTAT